MNDFAKLTNLAMNGKKRKINNIYTIDKELQYNMNGSLQVTLVAQI